MSKIEVYEETESGHEVCQRQEIEDAYYALWKKYGMRLWGEVYEEQGVMYGKCKGEKKEDALTEVFYNVFDPKTDKVRVRDVVVEDSMVEGDAEQSPMMAVRALIRRLASRKAGEGVDKVMRGQGR